ncbi:uncharacterized protein Bfra_008429 [Botrytis fragariae]|uniref:Uncharacterized protein n=1 Tax=Botrytis fragariae TaxID=1964551 RepID=A0A8H6EI80_9HELO|nr:uncharacterized protein Bfra_008429 [Botrytis fragariae]KAF5873151.1 hypothetical protein Bfra_008429 [Botrytis fragariae]
MRRNRALSIVCKLFLTQSHHHRENLGLGRSTSRICNERYYYVQDQRISAPSAISVGKELGGSDGMIEHDSGSDERSRRELGTSYSG